MQRIPKERARATKKQNQLFLSLANNTLIGVGVIKQQRFTFVNRKLASMTGYDRQELLALVDVRQIFPSFPLPFYL